MRGGSGRKQTGLGRRAARRYIFNILVDDGITYLCLTDEEDKRKRRVAFAFLEDIKDRFRRDYGDRVHTAVAFAMNTEFQSVLEDRMQFFNEDPSADSFSRVHGQLSSVKEVMVENIERVLERGEKIELLVEKTEELSASAKRFQHGSRNLKYMFWWKNVKMWLFITFIVLIIIYFIVSFICGFDFSKCGKK